MVNVDISELVHAAQNTLRIIFEDSIKVEDGVLRFNYAYQDGLPKPFSWFYDIKQQILYLRIQEDAFPFGSFVLEEQIHLPENVQKVKIIRKGEDVSQSSPEELIEYFFPGLRPKEE